MEHHTTTITHSILKKTFQVSSSPIMNKDNEIEYIVHVAQDITEQKRIEKELFQVGKMEAIGTLASGIAHDFNNILTAILGYSELAKVHIEDREKLNDDFANIVKGANRAKQLVKQILTFSRKDVHKFEVLFPHLIIKESLAMMRASLPTTIKIRQDIDGDCGAIKADPTKVQQILMNLCTNALHAMEQEKGILHVGLKQVVLTGEDHDFIEDMQPDPGEYNELSVSDTGCGMSRTTMERIFEPFFTTKEVGKGTGMGLAVVHGIVKDYKGLIKVESDPGKGSTFHVYFPVADRNSSEDTRPDDDSEALPIGTERILFVDDELTLVNLLKASLESLGYKVTAKTKGLEALEMFRRQPNEHDLIMTDQTMPEISGVELAREILSIRPDIPIILCTGYSSVITEREARKMGVRAFVMKPFDGKQIAEVIRTILDAPDNGTVSGAISEDA